MRTVVLVSLLLAAAPVAPGRASEHPVLRYHSRTGMEVDLARVVRDFVPPLLDAARGTDPAREAELAAWIDLLGLRALDRLVLENEDGLEGGRGSLTVTLAEGVDAGLLGELWNVPNGEFRFERYLAPGDAWVSFSVANFGGGLEAILGFAARPEVRPRLPFLFTGPFGEIGVAGIFPARDILPYLSGELTLLLFPPTGEPGGLPAGAVVLGVKDGAAMRGHLLEMAESRLGADTAALLREVPPEPVGEFSFYPLLSGVSYAVGPGHFILTTDPERMKGVVESAEQASAPVGRHHLRLKGTAIMDLLLLDLGERGPEQEALREAVRRELAGTPAGDLDLLTTAEGPQMTATMVQTGSSLAAYYRFVLALAQVVPRSLALETDVAGAREQAALLDGALSRYGEEHQGRFPEDLGLLIEEGYLETLPEMTPTPAGAYLRRGYTYLPLRNERGRITGYYLFLYGGGEGTGYDVFTDENRDAPKRFVIASDGAPDGVAAFCYDGAALADVEAWQRGQ